MSEITNGFSLSIRLKVSRTTTIPLVAEQDGLTFDMGLD